MKKHGVFCVKKEESVQPVPSITSSMMQRKVSDLVSHTVGTADWTKTADLFC